MEFDAASVKPHNPSDLSGARNNLGQPGGHVTTVNVSVRMLMAQAYDLNLSQAFDSIVGTPKWVDSERFDIEAEAEGNPSTAQKRLMLQSLLADRFKLALHHENRQLPVYALVLVKSGKPGPQLQPHWDDTTCAGPTSERTGVGLLQTGPGVALARSPSDFAASALQQFPCGRVVGGLLPNETNQVWSGGRKVTMGTIAASLGEMEPFDRPILDRTGVSGTFDFTVEWNHQLQNLSLNSSPDSPGLSLFEALQEQLGLKLESTKGPVEVLVIDHVEQPSEN